MSEAHGGKNTRELKSLGIASKDVLDLSANVSPFGTPAAVLKAIRETDVSVYPDAHCTELREALAKREGVRAENIIVGNGSTELIRLAAQAFARKGALIAGPTFAEYADACRGLGVPFKEIRAIEPNFTIDFRMWKKSPISNPSAIFVCNPNNPTGVLTPVADIEKLQSLFPDALLIVDEAFIHFTGFWAYSARRALKRHSLLLRSMTKLYAMPGIRLGYAVGEMELIEKLSALQPTWSVSGPAQAAGLVALKEERYSTKVVKEAIKNRTSVRNAFMKLGVTVIDSQTNFLLIKVGNAADFKKSLLLKHKILVRDCASFGLPEYIRVAVGDSEACERLVTATGAMFKRRGRIS